MSEKYSKQAMLQFYHQLEKITAQITFELRDMQKLMSGEAENDFHGFEDNELFILQKTNSSIYEKMLKALNVLDFHFMQTFSNNPMNDENLEFFLQGDYMMRCKFASDERLLIAIPRLLKSRENRNQLKAFDTLWYYNLARFRDNDIPAKFTMKSTNMQFVHIYSTSTPKACICDNDNLYYKRIIDVICDVFLLPDNGIDCHLHYAAVQSDAVREGTYCVISDQNKSLLSINSLLNEWTN